MKKAYINPEADVVLLSLQNMIALSTKNPENFDEELDDENSIKVDDMLSRRRDLWEDDEEEELY